MKRILIVEDYEPIRNMLAEMLTGAGYDVVAVADGTAAVGMGQPVNAAVSHHRPDLIILDYMLPGRTGLEVYQALQRDSATRAIPVLFVTAWAAQVQAAIPRDQLNLIEKPFHFADVLLVIAAMLMD